MRYISILAGPPNGSIRRGNRGAVFHFEQCRRAGGRWRNVEDAFKQAHEGGHAWLFGGILDSRDQLRDIFHEAENGRNEGNRVHVRSLFGGGGLRGERG